ncbi:MAG TPA: hypothetical protein VEV61_12150 [Streptosporangiaceae bacterium]|nr:hypothetical protein [Streptosporangiaceae bacterium]
MKVTASETFAVAVVFAVVPGEPEDRTEPEPADPGAVALPQPAASSAQAANAIGTTAR